MQQTDIGPAAWTGRGVDISAAAADRMGYTPKTFPTDARFVVAPADGAPDGWQTNVGPSSSGVGYVNPASVAQGATTNPAELVRKNDGGFVGNFLANFDFRPAAPVAQPEPFAFSSNGRPTIPFQQIGASRRGR
jgi:hypothetical protein